MLRDILKYIFIMGYRIMAVHQILVLVVQVRILVAQLINREQASE